MCMLPVRRQRTSVVAVPASEAPGLNLDASSDIIGLLHSIGAAEFELLLTSTELQAHDHQLIGTYA